MSAYLFVHFKEKTTPDGEQVYFGISRDGFNWEDINDSEPVLWNYVGTKGARDFCIIKHPINGKFYIVATDLSISYLSRKLRPGFWDKVGKSGSKNLIVWESVDLINWTESKIVKVEGEGEDFGCVWAPDAIWDSSRNAFMVHWSSSEAKDGYKKKRIYYSFTNDFETFTEAMILYEDDVDIIDSAIYQQDDVYYMFAKAGDPVSVRMFSSSNIDGPYERISKFDECVGDTIEQGKYEAPTAIKLDDGRWCLFIDFYGARGLKQGYVPFISDNISSGIFKPAKEDFSFPYGYKHGTILKITEEEYERIRTHDWSDKGYGPGSF